MSHNVVIGYFGTYVSQVKGPFLLPVLKNQTNKTKQTNTKQKQNKTKENHIKTKQK